MYSPRDKLRQQIICFYLRELYPVFYPEEQIQTVLRSIEQCHTNLELNRVLISPAFVREERLWQAYYRKRNTLVLPEQRRWRIKQQQLWPMPAWMRVLLINCIKVLLPHSAKRQSITEELRAAIQACNTLQELSALVHSHTLTCPQELDAIEQRLRELPPASQVPPPNYSSH